MIIDRLYKEVEKCGNVCVGLDTHYDYIPEEYSKRFKDKFQCILSYNKEVIDATLENCAVYKVQIAYYESLGIEGLKVYSETLKYIKKRGKLSIGDIKRGDIANTAKEYAKGHFQGDFECDFITTNPYMGMDSIEPFLEYIKTGEKGIFPLIRTSNKGSEDIQHLLTEKGEKVFEAAGDKIYKIGEEYSGECGYSLIGGVVGCTHESQSLEIRERYKNMFFLIPGYGAQGGKVKTIKKLLKNGNGGVVNSSRGILMAYKNYENGEQDPIGCAAQEVKKMRKTIGGE